MKRKSENQTEKPYTKEAPAEKKKLTKKEIGKEIASYLVLALGAVLLVTLLRQKVIVNAQVPTGSMETTVMTGDRIIVNRLTYQFGEPERGDIILFPYPDNEEENYLKRIIGLPGETLEIRDGKVYIDGSSEPLEEPYLTEEPSGNYEPCQIPADCYFVMGDNRMDSWDSRFWENTYVKREKITGKAVFRYFPNPGKLK